MTGLSPGIWAAWVVRVLLELLRDKGYDIARQHMDCGIEIFDAQTQDTHAGAAAAAAAR